MYRNLPTKLITCLILSICFLLSAMPAHAQVTNTRCAAFNRNWQCVEFSSGNAITLCVQIVTNGTVVSQSNRTFANQAAFQAFQASAPSGTQYLQCGATPTCTQSTQTQTLTCPSGQQGSITQTRTVNVGGVCGTNSAWTETANTCSAIPQNTCTTPWGTVLQVGQSVTAYSTQTAPNGQACVSETRTCQANGTLSGSFTFQTCSNPPRVCTTPWGQQLLSGQSVTACQTATVPYGQTCACETRICNDGALSGSFTNQTCNPNPPATCNLPWGGTIADGQSVTAYGTLTVPFGQLCTSEVRTCHNGTLSGSFTIQTCTPQQPRICTTPWGQQIGDGQSVTAYKTATTPYGQVCQSETRTCHDGSLSGSFTNQFCNQDQPNQCVLPWGGSIASGQSVTAYSVSGTGASQVCISETRHCNNGTLDGSFQLQSCPAIPQCTQSTETRTSTPCPSGQSGVITETRTVNQGGVCNSNSAWTITSNTCQAQVCNLLWGGTLADGQSVTAYSTQTTPFGQTCNSETRTCHNGTLSGSYMYRDCTVTPPQVCNLPWGGTLANGQSVTAYSTSGVSYGQQCISQTRTCNNGVLSGTYMYQNCTTGTASCNIELAAGNYMNLNVLQLAQQQNCPIVPGVHVTLTILPGANIGSNSVNFPAFTTGTGWPTNVVINVINYGRILGRGGDGAYVIQDSAVMVPAQPGGPAIDAPYPMTFNNAGGQIWAGGGGGATIGFGHCSPAGGGGAGRVIGNTFDPWGSCDANGNVVAANNNSGRVTRNGKNTEYLATDISGADNEYMIRSIDGDVNAAYYVSGPGGAPGQAGGNAHYYIRSSHGQPYGTPASTILGYYFYPTFPSSVTNVTGGDAGMAIVNPGNVTLTGGFGDRRGKDYPTTPPRAPTPQPPLENACTSQTETRTLDCAAGELGTHTQSRTLNVGGVCNNNSDWTDTSNTCQTPQNCTTPWGATVQSGQSVYAYQASTVAYGGTCVWQQRQCVNGTLSGSYGYQSCNPGQPQNCTTPWGTTVQHGQSVTAYQTSSAAYGSQCVSETRTCTNGTLSGSYTKQTCSVTPPANCTTPWGTTVADGQSVTAYEASGVAYGSQCNGETRTCHNGTLSGSFTKQNCSVTPAANCTGPDGRAIMNGQSVTYYANAAPAEGTACVSEQRSCSNGTLYGSFTATSCSQVICSIATAGDAQAKACTTTTYTGGTQTGSNTTTTPLGNGQATATSTSNASDTSAAAAGNGGTGQSSGNGTSNDNGSGAAAAGAAQAGGSATATGATVDTSSSSTAASASSAQSDGNSSSASSSSSSSNTSHASATGGSETVVYQNGTTTTTTNGDTSWLNNLFGTLFKQ